MAATRYIVETRHVEPKADGNWRFAQWPASVVATFVTAPAGVRLTPMGDAPGGFAKYRIEPA